MLITIMSMSIRTSIKMLIFYVPNNEEGQFFIRLMRKFQNRKEVKSIRVRGRGKNREEKMMAKRGCINQCKDIDISVSDYFAVYCIPTNEAKWKYGMLDEDINNMIQNIRMTSWEDGYKTGLQYTIPYGKKLEKVNKVNNFLKNRRQFKFEEV